MELTISVSDVAGVTTKVSVDGEPIGLLQEVTFRKTAEGLPEATFRFPPESFLRQNEAAAAAYEKHAALLRRIPWAVVVNGSNPVADSEIVRYFLGTGKDSGGRTISQVMAKDNSWFERSHNFIQWMLPTRSRYEPGGPVLTDEDVRAFGSRRDLRDAYSFAVDRFEGYLRLDQVRPGWVRAKDHNHKRVSRLIESLRDLGFRERAEGVLERVLRIDDLSPGVIDREAVEYWKKALSG